MISGLLNSAPLLAPLEPDGNGGHWLDISDSLQAAAHIEPGKPANLEIEATKDWPEPPIPADWQKILDEHEDIRGLWGRVTPMARWEWLRWINSTARQETRAHRLEVSCSKLRNGLRRPCCFNRNMCCVPAVSKNGVLLSPQL